MGATSTGEESMAFGVGVMVVPTIRGLLGSVGSR